MMVKKFYLATLFDTSWMGAFSFCKTSGMDLANFRNRDELDHFMSLFIKLVEDPINQVVFTDGIVNDPIGRESWHWFETGKKIEFEIPWHTDEPNNMDGNEHCLRIDFRSGVLGFNDVSCKGVARRFVCQEIVAL
jgi:hypothetical protein